MPTNEEAPAVPADSVLRTIPMAVAEATKNVPAWAASAIENAQITDEEPEMPIALAIEKAEAVQDTKEPITWATDIKKPGLQLLTGNEKRAIGDIRWWHRIPVGYSYPDGEIIYTPGEVHHGVDGGEWPSTRFGLPEDLTGMSVLDIGAWDGFFSFEAEKRGAASVIAVDAAEEEGGHWGGTAGFDLARKLLNSQVEYVESSIYDLHHYDKANPQIHEAYDLVLFYGVLYHLPFPQTAIKQLARFTKPGGILLLETACLGDQDSVWRFRPGHDGDASNLWYPSKSALIEALQWADFEKVEIIYDMGTRCTIRAIRRAD